MEYKAVDFKADDVEGREFSGYAATWDKDLGDDIILKGAFAETLKERGERVKILWQHRDPLGKPVEMKEDDQGLFVVGKVSNTRLGDEALELMKDGVVDQMSIGFSVTDSEDEDGVRTIKELKLFEFSPVTFPMNEAAFITSVKSITPREIERVLREAGLSISQAKAIACGGVKNLREAEADNEDDEIKLQLLDSLKQFGRMPAKST